MSLFWYQAINAAGETEEGEIEASVEELAVAQLQDAGFIPIRVEPAGQTKRRKSGGGLSFSRGKKRITHKDIGDFTRELATMLGAGLPLDSALQTLNEVSDNPQLQTLTLAIYEKVRSGRSFSDALMEMEGNFPDLYIQMVKAGEAAGALDSSLARLSEHFKRANKLREDVISALTYPLILVAIAGLSILVLMTFVIPQFSQMFEDMGADLPTSTQIVISTSAWLKQWWWTIPPVLLLAVIVWQSWYAKAANRLSWDTFVLKLPLFGDFSVRIDMTRFTHTLGVTLGHGVSLIQAMQIATKGMSNQALAQMMVEALEQVQQGRTLATALEEHPDLPRLLIKMIRVGEESGQLEKMLMELAELYENQTQLAVQRLLSLLEPVLIVGLGLLIAGIIMSILVAVLGMNELVF